MELAVLGPCVNRSEVPFVAEDGAVRVGLMQVRGIRPATTAAIVAERQRHGPYLARADLVARVRVRRRELDTLERCGALDACRSVSGGRHGPGRLLDELETLGFGVCGHPLDLFLPLQRGPRDLAVDLPGRVGRQVRLAGWRIAHKPLRTRGGRSMELLSFEDETALYEAAVFPAAHARAARALLEAGPFWITGRVCEDRGVASVAVDRLEVMEVPDGSVGSRLDGVAGTAGTAGPAGADDGRLPQRLASG
jgi:DNA polymerase III alpha subunit